MFTVDDLGQTQNLILQPKTLDFFFEKKNYLLNQ